MLEGRGICFHCVIGGNPSATVATGKQRRRIHEKAETLIRLVSFLFFLFFLFATTNEEIHQLIGCFFSLVFFSGGHTHVRRSMNIHGIDYVSELKIKKKIKEKISERTSCGFHYGAFSAKVTWDQEQVGAPESWPPSARDRDRDRERDSLIYLTRCSPRNLIGRRVTEFFRLFLFGRPSADSLNPTAAGLILSPYRFFFKFLVTEFYRVFFSLEFSTLVSPPKRK